MRHDPNRALLEVAPDDLKTLVRVAAGGIDPATLPDRWAQSGILVDGTVHPTVLAMVAVATAPHRWITIDRNDGRRTSRLQVGWDRHGRATMTDQGPDGTAAITATRLELLPALVLQAVRLHGGVPQPEGREPIRTTGRMIDEWMLSLRTEPTSSDAPASTTAPPNPPAGLQEVLAQWDHGFHATGGWLGQPADTACRIVDCGRLGLWEVVVGDSTAADDPVTLVPASRQQVMASLGDVVTGRAAIPTRPAQPNNEE